MKHLSLTCLFALFCLTLLAQKKDPEADPDFSYTDEKPFYLRIGLSNAGGNGFHGASLSSKRTMGFVFAVGATSVLSEDERLWLDVELGLASQGLTFSNVQEYADLKEVNLMYFQLPVEAKYHPLPKARFFYVSAGPQVGLLVINSSKNKAGTAYDQRQATFNAFELSGVTAAGVVLSKLSRFTFEVRYQQGLTNFLSGTPGGKSSVFQFCLVIPWEVFANFDFFRSPNNPFQYSPPLT